MSYLKGLYHAILGRVEFVEYDCRPTEEVDIEEFSDRISQEYSEALEPVSYTHLTLPTIYSV